MPILETVDVKTDRYGNRWVYKETKYSAKSWKLMEMLGAVIITAISPVILVLILFCFGEGIYS